MPIKPLKSKFVPKLRIAKQMPLKAKLSLKLEEFAI